METMKTLPPWPKLLPSCPLKCSSTNLSFPHQCSSHNSCFRLASSVLERTWNRTIQIRTRGKADRLEKTKSYCWLVTIVTEKVASKPCSLRGPLEEELPWCPYKQQSCFRPNFVALKLSFLLNISFIHTLIF